jgi:hypothetical protein
MPSDQHGKAQLIAANGEMCGFSGEKRDASQQRKSLLNKETLE